MVDNYRIEIDSYLKGKSHQAKRLMWQVVKAVKVEYDLRENPKLRSVYFRLRDEFGFNKNDAELIFRLLERKKIIIVSDLTPPAVDTDYGFFYRPMRENYDFQIEILDSKYLSELYKILDQQINKDSNNQDHNLVAALQLTLEGNRLCLVGLVIGGTVELRAIRGGSSALIEPIINACKSNPYKWKNITIDDLKSKDGVQNKELEKAAENIKNFKKYLSGIGLQGELRKLFFGNSPKGLRFKFRTAVSQEEWNNHSPKVQRDIVKRLEEIGSSKTTISQS